MVDNDIIAKPAMAAKSKASSKVWVCERRISPRPKKHRINTKTFLRLICGFTEARKTAPAIAPIPVTLLRYPYVAAFPCKVILAMTGSRVI